MPVLVAFASLPFGLRGGQYQVAGGEGELTVHVSPLAFNPFITISSRPELAQAIPQGGQGEGYTTYTWYDHPFVLRVLFGRNVASLGSINSCATIVRPLPAGFDLDAADELSALRDRFAEEALGALNHLIALVRRRARLYHVFDLRRDDIDISVRREDGLVLRRDPLQDALAREEEAESERFDLAGLDDDWYRELSAELQDPDPVNLAADLLMEAERALTQRFPRQAITTCHSALETAVSALLTRGMARRDLEDPEIDHILSTRSLPSKCDGLLRSYTGFSLKRDQPGLWRAFMGLGDLRNDIVHRGKQPSVEEAEEAISTTREILRWFAVVRQRNR